MQFFSTLLKGGDDTPGILPSGTAISVNNRTIKILDKIGEGGFATVYSARDHQRKYAVKHCKCMSQEQVDLIDREIQIMEKIATINHRNIVSYYGTSKKVLAAKDMMPRTIEYFILMEFMDLSLISLIKQYQQQNKSIPEKKLLSLFLDVVNGLLVLHSLRPPIAHRDIKIDNVLISYKDQVNHSDNVVDEEVEFKICDFGSCVDGTPRICEDTKEINIETELIDRFTTPSYRSPEMIDLYQRKELSTKVDIWALGCVLFLMAYFEHPFPDGAKMSILDAKYKIPDKARYSKKVSKLIKMLFHKDPNKRPDCKQLSEHLTDILSGGKGTLKSKKDKKRSNSNVDQTKTHLTLSPKSNLSLYKRNSMNAVPEEIKLDTPVDDEWDPFDDEDDEEDSFADPFGNIEDDNTFQVANSLQASDVQQQYDANNNGNQANNNNVQQNGGGGSADDPFFSTDFAKDFFGNDAQGTNPERPSSAKVAKKRKSGSKPKPIDSGAYVEHESVIKKRKKKKEKPSRSRSKSPTPKSHQNSLQTHKQQNYRKSQPPPQLKHALPKQAKPEHAQPASKPASQDPSVVYGDQLAQLMSMGFNDSEKNVKAILRAKGNVQVAVNILIMQ